MANFIGNLSLVGFLDGITATGIIISSVLFGLVSFYKARKLEAKLLSVAGLLMIFVGCLWLGPTADFFSVLLTGNNLNPTYIYGWLSYMWVFPAIVTGFYIGAELMVPDKKKVIVGIYTVIGIIFEFFIFTMPVTGVSIFGIQFEPVFVINPPVEGDLIDSGFNRASPAYWIILFLQISSLIFLAIGFAIKAKQATGELRKKFAFLSCASFIFFICGLFDALTIPGPYLVIWRATMMSYSFFMYLGLKT